VNRVARDIPLGDWPQAAYPSGRIASAHTFRLALVRSLPHNPNNIGSKSFEGLFRLLTKTPEYLQQRIPAPSFQLIHLAMHIIIIHIPNFALLNADRSSLQAEASNFPC